MPVSDPELKTILLSGLPTKDQEELVAYMQRRAADREQRLESLRMAIRLARGRHGPT